MKKEILILTSSFKHGAYCVAGIDLENDKWIRLVSSDDIMNNAIPKRFMHYSDGTECKPLDVVLVEVIEDMPEEIQVENALVDISILPVFLGKVETCQLYKYISDEQYIYNGTSSYISFRNIAVNCGHSLGLYKVENICLNIYEFEGNLKRKVSFDYNGRHYEDWSMTDPDYWRSAGCMFDEGLIVVSIPEDDYNGNYYKFVSKIIRL